MIKPQCDPHAIDLDYYRMSELEANSAGAIYATEEGLDSNDLDQYLPPEGSYGSFYCKQPDEEGNNNYKAKRPCLEGVMVADSNFDEAFTRYHDLQGLKANTSTGYSYQSNIPGGAYYGGNNQYMQSYQYMQQRGMFGGGNVPLGGFGAVETTTTETWQPAHYNV